MIKVNIDLQVGTSWLKLLVQKLAKKLDYYLKILWTYYNSQSREINTQLPVWVLLPIKIKIKAQFKRFKDC